MEQKSCQVFSSVMHCTRGESGKETLWSQTLKNWKRWTHLSSTPEGSMLKEVLTPQTPWNQKFFKENQMNYTHLQEDSTWDDEEAKNDFWTITGEFIYRHHGVPRVKLYMPKAESFPIPLKYIDDTRTTHTSQDVLSEKQTVDYWNEDEETELSDTWTGFTRFISIE